MGQLFSQRADRRLRRIALAVLALAVLLFAWGMMRTSGAAAGDVGKPVAQPIPFSHRQHVSLGLDCATCHETADTAAEAGMPGTETCLACHDDLFRGTRALQPLHEAAQSNRQIAWNAVTNLPEVARFHHGMHVRSGVPCAACHGDVATMETTTKAKPLTMQWCVECHREVQDPASDSAIRPISEWHRDLTDCSVCHY
ncbi:cytochrome c3 family protein [Sphingosinithalassobacter sp. CS137]|uniref:cytochrome c3 family protein n=1 Tax=Sphingosinithalassobacter sp. CS137 TaxID=2762748 RepID=UPI00165D9655|nr:cytochrome c3 family protein [Sphingosinithalassobacter sp. CS137]